MNVIVGYFKIINSLLTNLRVMTTTPLSLSHGAIMRRFWEKRKPLVLPKKSAAVLRFGVVSLSN